MIIRGEYINRKCFAMEAYTPEKPPKRHLIPRKEPYLVLVFEDNSENQAEYKKNLSDFRRLGHIYNGYGKISIVITGNGKVSKAIHTLQAIYKNNNDETFKELQNYSNKLNKKPPSKELPRKGRPASTYAVVGSITSDSSASHVTKKVQHTNKSNKTKDGVFKTETFGRRITEIEAFNAICFRLLLNDMTPKVHAVYDEQGNRLGSESSIIENFHSLDNKFLPPPSIEDLAEAGMGRILAADYTEEENDARSGNMAYNPVTKKLHKFDHDQATWPITSTYAGIDPLVRNISNGGLAPVNAFPVTQSDFDTFPYLTNAKPFNFPTKDNSRINLNGIEKIQKFKDDVHLTWLKRILIGTDVYQRAAEATITSPKLRERLVNHKAQRTALLRSELLKNPNFLQYVASKPNLKNEVLAEFERYNQEYKDASPLRVDLNEIERNFSALEAQAKTNLTSRQVVTLSERTPLLNKSAHDNVMRALKINEARAANMRGGVPQPAATVNRAPVDQRNQLSEEVRGLFKTHYKPDADTVFHLPSTYGPIGRKEVRAIFMQDEFARNGYQDTATLFDLALDDWKATQSKFFETDRTSSAQQLIETLKAKIAKLDGKLGRFGGEERVIDGQAVKIPKSAALILDELEKDGKDPSERIMNAIAYAEAAKNRTDHGFFNRRQPETTRFYNEVAGIIKPTVFEEGVELKPTLKT